MANAFYSQGMKHFAFGDIIWKNSGGSTIKALLIDTADETFNGADEFHSNITGAGIEETSGAMTLVDAADDGVLDASDVTFTATSGDACEAIIVYKDTGVSGTSPLLFWWDTASGLPVTLGGDVTVTWDNGANKIAKI